MRTRDAMSTPPTICPHFTVKVMWAWGATTVIFLVRSHEHPVRLRPVRFVCGPTCRATEEAAIKDAASNRPSDSGAAHGSERGHTPPPRGDTDELRPGELPPPLRAQP